MPYSSAHHSADGAVFSTESSPRILQSSFSLCCILGIPASCDSSRCFSSVSDSRVAVSSCSKRQPPSPSNCSRCVWYLLGMWKRNLPQPLSDSGGTHSCCLVGGIGSVHFHFYLFRIHIDLKGFIVFLNRDSRSLEHLGVSEMPVSLPLIKVPRSTWNWGACLRKDSDTTAVYSPERRPMGDGQQRDPSILCSLENLPLHVDADSARAFIQQGVLWPGGFDRVSTHRLRKTSVIFWWNMLLYGMVRTPPDAPLTCGRTCGPSPSFASLPRIERPSSPSLHPNLEAAEDHMSHQHLHPSRKWCILKRDTLCRCIFIDASEQTSWSPNTKATKGTHTSSAQPSGPLDLYKCSRFRHQWMSSRITVSVTLYSVMLQCDRLWMQFTRPAVWVRDQVQGFQGWLVSNKILFLPTSWIFFDSLYSTSW